IPLALALRARDVDILDEVHLELLDAIAFTGLAAPARYVEREGAGAEPERLRARQPGEELADLVEGLDVGHGIGARRPADGLLIDEADAAEMLQTTKLGVFAGRLELHLEVPRDGAVERVVDQRRLAGARDARHAGEGVKGNPQGHVLQVVRPRAT